jgi:hypothetical protein
VDEFFVDEVQVLEDLGELGLEQVVDLGERGGGLALPGGLQFGVVGVELVLDLADLTVGVLDVAGRLLHVLAVHR